MPNLIAFAFLVIYTPQIAWSMEDSGKRMRRAHVPYNAGSTEADLTRDAILQVRRTIVTENALGHLLPLLASAPRAMRWQLDRHIEHARLQVSRALGSAAKPQRGDCQADASGCSPGFYAWLDGVLGFNYQEDDAESLPPLDELEADELERILGPARAKQYYCSIFKKCEEIDSCTVVVDEDDLLGTQIYESLATCKKHCEKNDRDKFDPGQSLSLAFSLPALVSVP